MSTLTEQLFVLTYETIPHLFSYVRTTWLNFWYANSPIANGILLQIGIIMLIGIIYNAFPKSSFSVFWSVVTEKMYEFFEEIMGKNEKPTIKVYIVVLFFIIVISNLLGLMIDFLKLPFPILEELVHIPTANINYTAALATIGVGIMLIIQHKFIGGFAKQLHEYIPITGKNIISIERGTMHPAVYWPAAALIKLFDIIISLFIGFLDIIGLLAKVISLSARLAGNMTSGPILLAMLVAAITALTQSIGGIDLPIIAPLIVYAQGLLVALIQAFVFPLLVGIFIKMAQT